MSKTYNYEGMFLISQAVAADLSGAVEHITDILAKVGAELISMRKWDERRLAYEIDKNKRGVFILVYFSAPGDSITQLERECNLSERILRLMTIRADHLSMDEMKAADARDELATEAKLRAERAAAASERGAGVTLGAPPQAAQVAVSAPAEAPTAVAEAPAEEAPVEKTEAPAEAQTEVPAEKTEPAAEGEPA